jgi:hypothetical protein
MAVQATGAMAIIVADVQAVHDAGNQIGRCSRSHCSQGRMTRFGPVA